MEKSTADMDKLVGGLETAVQAVPQLRSVFEAQHDNAGHIQAYHDAALAHFRALAGRADGALAGARAAGAGNGALASELEAGNRQLLANQAHLAGVPHFPGAADYGAAIARAEKTAEAGLTEADGEGKAGFLARLNSVAAQQTSAVRSSQQVHTRWCVAV